jgi:hypothetical protein
LDPSADDLQSLDRELKDANDKALVEIMTELLIPVDVPDKSRILLHSVQMPGSDVRQQIRNACTFFLNTRDL